MTFMNTFKNLYVCGGEGEKKRRGGEGREGEGGERGKGSREIRKGGMEAGKDKQWKVK